MKDSKRVLENRALILMETISEREFRLQQALEQIQFLRSHISAMNKRYQISIRKENSSYRSSLRFRLHSLNSVNCMFWKYISRIYDVLVDLYDEMDRIQLELIRREESELR